MVADGLMMYMHRYTTGSKNGLPPLRLSAQEAMRAAEATSTEECPVKIKLVAPPLYVLTTNVRCLSRAAFF